MNQDNSEANESKIIIESENESNDLIKNDENDTSISTQTPPTKIEKSQKKKKKKNFKKGKRKKKEKCLDAGLNPSQVKSFYDWFGSWQDYNKFYELNATKEMIKNLKISEKDENSLRVLEIGCGTGSTGELILKDYEKYIKYIHLIDISSTMVKLTNDRFDQLTKSEIFKEKSKLVIEESNFLDKEKFIPKEKYDIIYTTFVFDAINNENIVNGMNRIYDFLKDDGLFGIVCLTKGKGFFAKINTVLWELMYRISPKSMGGCRPLIMDSFFDKNKWEKIYYNTSTAAKMITSEISIVKKKIINEIENPSSNLSSVNITIKDVVDDTTKDEKEENDEMVIKEEKTETKDEL